RLAPPRARRGLARARCFRRCSLAARGDRRGPARSRSHRHGLPPRRRAQKTQGRRSRRRLARRQISRAGGPLVTRLVPPVFTLIRAPERAAVAALVASTALARNALVAAHPHLACKPTGEPIDRAVRRILRRLDRL